MVFDIVPNELETLDSHRLVLVVNRCLEGEAARLRLPPNSVKTNLRVDDPDAGIDARVSAAADTASSWIPAGESVWQCKSGNIYPVKIKNEFLKLGVQKAVKEGATYCLVIAKGYSEKSRERREAAIESCFAQLGLSPRYQLLTASELARWASLQLDMLLEFRHPIGGLKSHQRWSQEEVHQIRFYRDEGRQAVISEIQRWASGTGLPIHQRIEGAPGVGKTRLALESLRPAQFAHLTYYAQERDDLPRELFAWFEARRQISLILVVDECDRETARKLGAQAERCDGRVRLLTIGHAPSRTYLQPTPQGVYLLMPLESQQMEHLLEVAFPTLHREARRWVATWARGYVTLARALAEAIQGQPELAGAAKLARDFEVQEVLETLVPLETERKAMKVVALLTRVGWEDALAVEGQAVAQFIGIAWSEAQDIIHHKQQQGLIQKQGRYRYVTPHILAVWLASEVWNARGDDTLRLLEVLPSVASRRAFLERLVDFGDDERARSVARKLLGPDGFFPDLASMDEPTRSEILGLLTLADRGAGLSALERILSHLSPDELRQLNGGRRHVVWTLEKLAWHRDTFSGAARLLLALAEAENETWSNNATGVWLQLFQTRLGGTEVSALERHELIEEALESASVERRLLAVRAIGSALAIHEMRGGEAEYQRGIVIPPEWHPKTLEEDRDVRLSALGLLDKALKDRDPRVVVGARRVLLEKARSLVVIGLAKEALVRVDSLSAETYEEKREIRETLENILDFDRARLTKEEQNHVEEMCRELAGTTYRDRLRRWVGKWTLADWRRTDDEEKPRSEEEIAALAIEGFEFPTLLESELDWLASPDAERVWFFGHALGERDSEREWLSGLLDYARQEQGLVLLAGYLAGRAQASEERWREEILDEWADEQPQLAQAVYEATWRGQPTDRGAQRLLRLLETSRIQPHQLGILAWGEWIKSLSLETCVGVIQGLAEDESESATEQALGMLQRRLAHFPEEKEPVSAIAWELLARPAALTGRGTIAYQWGQVAASYVRENPARLARLVVSGICDHDAVFLTEDRHMKALETATKVAPRAVWDEISSILLSRSSVRYRLELTLRGWYANFLDTTFLIQWARDNRPDGARILAELSSVGGTPLGEPARSLLVEFGDDKSVRSGLATSFLSGVFAGPAWAWHQQKLDQAKAWAQDDDPNVRQWASDLVAHLETEIEREKLVEEELGL